MDPFLLVALKFLSLGYGRRFNQLLFWFRTVIELYAGSFPREQCTSITGLRPFLHQEGQDYLDGSRKRETNESFLEGFLTSVAETLQHVGAMVFLSGLHYLEICLYIVKAPSAFWSPERDYFLQLKDFPTLRCGLCNLVSPRLEEGIHAGTRRFSGSLTLESAILLF